MSPYAFTVKSSWLASESCRLDASAYSEGGLEVRDRIKAGSSSWRALKDIAQIFRGPLHKRIYVPDANFGVPYLTASDVPLVDYPVDVWLSRERTSELPALLVKKGWTLISSAGTIGNAAFVRQAFVGCAISQDMIRVAPTDVASGYLFAFLATRPARSMLRLSTYGSVVERIEPKHIADIPVPLIDNFAQDTINGLVLSAAAARDEAEALIAEATDWIDASVSEPRYSHEHSLAVGIIGNKALGTRLDAFHHVGWAAKRRISGERLGDIADVSRPGIIKRIFVERGIPFVSGIDVFHVRPEYRKRLMTDEARRSGALLSKGQVLVQRSGQRYGLLGRPAYVGQRLDRWAASEDLMRVTPSQEGAAARVFALLRSDVGRRSLVRMSYGTSIPHFNQEQLAELRVPTLPLPLLEKVEHALELRERADRDEAAAIAEVETWLDLLDLGEKAVPQTRASVASLLTLSRTCPMTGS